MISLKDRFIALWHRNAYTGRDDFPAAVFDELLTLYSEDWRTYHNTTHIESCIGYFDDCRDHAEFADAVELAIWFHDCIYNLGDKENEAKSRDWFLEKSSDRLVPAACRRVDELIMDTRHIVTPDTADGKLIADIDLTSFGLPWDEYVKDSQAVQLEFAPQPMESIVRAKIDFLNMLTQDGQIYYSDYYLEHFELKAKQNVQRHMSLLKDSLEQGNFN